MDIKDLQEEAHEIATEKGWHDKPRSIGDLIALCHAELSEALGEYRASPNDISILYRGGIGHFPDEPHGFPIELADLIIRVADMAELYGVDLEQAIRVKMDYNRTRPYRHGGKAL